MATSYAKRARDIDNAGASFYFLIESAAGYAVADESFNEWAKLAQFVRNREPEIVDDVYSARVKNGILRAYTQKNVPINLVRLLECKKQDYDWGWYGRPVKGYVRRSTPVPYTSKMRGGRSYYRRVGTFAEARDNLAVEVLEEGGKWLVRSARKSSNLPNAYDDIAYARKNGWKAQHKGLKSWDHPVRHGSKEVFQ